MNKLKVTLRVDFDPLHAIGPGKVALLEKMRDCGSLSQAARELDMSYRRAWQLLDSLNQSFDEPVVLTSVGGSGGGGTRLTALGESVVSSYRAFEQDTNARAAKCFAPLLRSVRAGAGSKPRSVARGLHSAHARRRRRKH